MDNDDLVTPINEFARKGGLPSKGKSALNKGAAIVDRASQGTSMDEYERALDAGGVPQRNAPPADRSISSISPEDLQQVSEDFAPLGKKLPAVVK